jgi:alpha-beta hydrolase superfamily lysophospholipase
LPSPALNFGFYVLAFDGPAQGEALRKQKLVFKRDWEKVLTPVVHYDRSRPDVDDDKIVLYGINMGGYLVARAAAYEHRAAAMMGHFLPITTGMLLLKPFHSW